DSASISSKHNKLQNSQDSANGTRPDFTVQNYSNYEIFTLEVAGSPTNKIQKKIKTDFAKLTSTEGFDIVIKRMISIDRYVIIQEIFTIEVPSCITDYYKLKILISRVMALSVLIDQSLK
ncbi:6065_t:CDS:2, partial [Dentiscutata heterogama]